MKETSPHFSILYNIVFLIKVGRAQDLDECFRRMSAEDLHTIPPGLIIGARFIRIIYKVAIIMKFIAAISITSF